MEKGKEIFNALVELERKFWAREDYSEECRGISRATSRSS